MNDATTPARDVDLLRAIRELADPAAHDEGPAARLPAMLERLLDCEAVVADEPRRALPRIPTAEAGGQTELVIEGAIDGAVRGEVRLRRPLARPFGEDEVLLCDLLRPHLSAWLKHRSDPSDRSGRSALTRRQLEIVGLVRCGLSNKEVAHALGLTPATVRKHLENAFVRLGVTNRTAAVAEVFRDGSIVTPFRDGFDAAPFSDGFDTEADHV